MLDSEPLVARGRRPADLTTVAVDALSSVQYKLFAFIFLIFVVLNSDVFVCRILARFPGAVEQKCVTNYGVCLQAVTAVLACVVTDVCIQNKIV